jgi:hypothetical protein
MPNHYHLVVETPDPNLAAGMAWLQSPYTLRLNHRHKELEINKSSDYGTAIFVRLPRLLSGLGEARATSIPSSGSVRSEQRSPAAKEQARSR